MNWVSPELKFIQSQLAATIPNARAAELLELLLPVDFGNAASTVRRHALRVGQRLDLQLRASVETVSVDHSTDTSPVTDVGMDCVRDCRPTAEGSFEIVAGRILCKNKGSRSLGFVRSIEDNRAGGDRLKRRLSEQGPIADDVTVLTDNDPGLRGLLMSVLPKAHHLLDWFHLTRRLTVLKRVLDGKEAIDQFQSCYHDR